MSECCILKFIRYYENIVHSLMKTITPFRLIYIFNRIVITLFVTNSLGKIDCLPDHSLDCLPDHSLYIRKTVPYLVMHSSAVILDVYARSRKIFAIYRYRQCHVAHIIIGSNYIIWLLLDFGHDFLRLCPKKTIIYVFVNSGLLESDVSLFSDFFLLGVQHSFLVFWITFRFQNKFYFGFITHIRVAYCSTAFLLNACL